MHRRDFVKVICGISVVWPLTGHAQQAGKLPVIGFLGSTTSSATPLRTAAFVQRLSELGWIDGRTVVIDYRWAEGRSERASELATEFARLKVDVIVTSGAPMVLAAKQATSAIPIVFALAPNPVGTGLVASLARPGGNVTGVTNLNTELAGKRLEILREIVPDLRRVAILVDSSNPGTILELAEVQAAAHALGLALNVAKIRQAEDIAPAFAAFTGQVDGLYVVADPLMNTNRARIHTLALGARLPAIYNSGEFVEAGGLISYGSNLLHNWRLAASIVDKILKGAKPADLPVEEPTKFELMINLTTAKALGLTISPTVLAHVDQVIE
jgi:putative ABC transport system substrate-binding protein